MHQFQLYTIESAPTQSRPVLTALKEAFGILPNVAATMAASPVLINAFAEVFQRVHAGSFSEAQIQVLLLTNAVTNACAWAVAFHTALALKKDVDPNDIQAIRGKRLPSNPEQAALSMLARKLIEQRGLLKDADLQAFLSAGFKAEQAFEVILVSAASTITNYVSNVTQPPLEEAFESHAWFGSSSTPPREVNR